MGNIYKGTLGLIGNTPLVEVVNVEKELGLEATVLVKLEYLSDLRQYRNRSGGDCSIERLPGDPDHAGNHEH